MKCCDHYGHNCQQGRKCPLRSEPDEEPWSLAALFVIGIIACAFFYAAGQTVWG